MSNKPFIGRYKDMELIPKPPDHVGCDIPCHVCDQYGAYYRPEYPRTASSCGHCWGWGWIDKSNTCKGHEWKHVKPIGKCLTLWECEHCGQEREVDSSD